MKNYVLKQQLRKAGATSQEARNLTAVTDDLRGSIPHLDASAKQRIAQEIGLDQRPVYARPRFAFAGSLVALIVVCIIAQFAQPGSPLYAIKRATEEMRVIVQPSFKAELQQIRHDDQKKIDEQQKTDDTRSSGGEESPKSSPSSEDTHNDVNLNDGGSGKAQDVKLDSSGGGSGVINIPVDSSGDSSGSSGSGDVKLNDVSKSGQSSESH